MARELKHYITLREGPADGPSTFGPGDKLPEWVLERIEGKDHLFVESDGESVVSRHPAVTNPDGLARQPKEEPTPVLTEPAATDLGKSELEDAPDEDDVPRRNASRVTWAAFAKDLKDEGYNIAVTDGMSRDDIIKACEEAGAIEAD